MNRRAFGLALSALLAGAGLALFAVTRTWSLEVTPRPGMSALRAAHTGADAEPWVLGLAVAALAGTGALLATSGRSRRLLGALLTAVGAGILVGAVVGRLGLDPGAAGAGGTLWPIACAIGGAGVVGGGLAALRRGHRWPGMSGRYERSPSPTAAPVPPARATSASPAAPMDPRTAWDALDRGDDPTA